MNLLKRTLVVSAMVLLWGVSARAQGRGPGGPPGQPHAPGGPGGPPPPRGGGRGDAGGGSESTGSTATSSTATHGVPRLGPAGRWWDDGNVIRTVGLSHEQQRRMDSIFDANKAAIVSSYMALESEKSKLAKLENTPQVDQKQVFAAIDAVSQARTSLEKATTQMLLQIRGEMKPEQVQKLETVR